MLLRCHLHEEGKLSLSSNRALIAAAAVILAGVSPARVVIAQDLVPRPTADAAHRLADAPPFVPGFSTRRELLLTGVGAGLLVAGAMYPINTQVVPLHGLDPGEIALSVDQDVVGNRDPSLAHASDWTRDAAMLLPFVVALAVAPSDGRWEHFGRRSAVYAQTFLVNLGTTVVLKTTLGRPRPFAYLAEGLRPSDPSYDATQDRAFRSMPSGHSSTAWTGASLVMTEHLLSRPRARGVERFGVGFAMGALASATSSLRAAAGQHFPSDVIAGAGIGVASGVVVPLLHRGETPIPPADAWLQMAGGTAAGIILGIVLAR